MADTHLTESVDDFDDLGEDVLGGRLVEPAVLLDALEEVARAATFHRRRSWRVKSVRRARRVSALHERRGESWGGGRSDGLRALEDPREVGRKLRLHRCRREEGEVGGSGA